MKGLEQDHTEQAENLWISLGLATARQCKQSAIVLGTLRCLFIVVYSEPDKKQNHP